MNIDITKIKLELMAQGYNKREVSTIINIILDNHGT